jgi:hypothetical protein
VGEKSPPRPPRPPDPNDDIVASLAEYFRDAHAAARPHAFRIIVSLLAERYGRRLVDRALVEYGREMRRENRRLKRENRDLERQWLKRQTP